MTQHGLIELVPDPNPVANAELEVNTTADGLVVFDPGRERVHYLNGPAAVVFTLCDGARDRHAIAEALSQAYDLDDAPIEQVDGCLAQLRDEGLVR